MLSNFITNSPMTWLNFVLTDYVAQNQILPDTQVAMQTDIQARDLTSYLSAVKCWSKRSNQTIYALKRDQMKGFDYLSPEGMYDTVQAYGLPSSIIDLDRAAQSDTRCFIRTAHGITDPIVINGVSKQGGPLSPMKSTLTTSLGHYYMRDLLLKDLQALIAELTNTALDDPHLSDDYTRSLIGMTEATDNTYIFARTLDALQKNTLCMESFQFSYGWVTQWSKTVAYVLQPHQDDIINDNKATLFSIDTSPGGNPENVVSHEVPLVANKLEFLRTRIDCPKE